PAPFADMLARSGVQPVEGVPAPVCSLADLVEMKWALGRGGDRLDLARLLDVHGRLPQGLPPSGSGSVGAS
ncbi:MAG: hypothetical protein ACRDMZ_12630, partial [Solirubrobacteraceae bacterium]